MSERRYKKLKTAPQLKKLLEQHYLAAKYFHLGKPIAWVTSGAPVEIVRALDIFPVYPENYGALCGARGASAAMCQVAEARVYSPDLCAYARSSVGMMSDAKHAPLGGLPRPDLLITCGNICGTVLKWYEAAARHYHAPLFILDTPFIHADDGEPTAHAIAYVAAQLEELIAFLEKQTRRKLSKEKLLATAMLSSEAVSLWCDVREFCRARPSPLNAPDLFLNMAPIVTLRGTKECAQFYRALKEEIAERVARQVSALPEEKYRLVWDNIAIWHHLYRFYNHFVDYGACFVTDTYTGGWAMRMNDQGDPIHAFARTYTQVFLNQSLRVRVRDMADLITRFDVDGFVMHSNRSCKPYSVGQYDIRRIVTEQTGKPGLVIEADHSDPRSYDDETIRARIQTFMEGLR
ncbi:MAG: 2-hydroxyacyl-CoA dehydratase [Chloroflexi bacterium]|nr:2-hydroxyacyl-CoA dehydratase [Chloroflexota bacterium]